ncbi:hypothetical protein [uncultured Duncaniella sp.]|nr:hypothetical protein [uncultured Duncaniella sp.]
MLPATQRCADAIGAPLQKAAGAFRQMQVALHRHPSVSIMPTS